MTDLIDRFSWLFRGRSDAFGLAGDRPSCIRTQLVPADWQRHLDGTQPIGIYSMVPHSWTLAEDKGNWLCFWGCVDFDIKSDHHKSYDFETEVGAHEAAVALRDALVMLHIVSWIERTRSGGRHVWVFAKEPVTCAVMRRALLVASDIAGVPTTEVNPKAETQPSADVLGNFVRVPYANVPKRELGERPSQLMIWPDERPVGIGVFLERAWLNRTPPDVLEKAAALYRPPRQSAVEVTIDQVNIDQLGRLGREIDGLGYTILKEGHLGDRSAGLYKLAGCCRRSDFTPSEALTVITFADDFWGKYVGRADREQRLIEIVERVYGRDE